MRQIDVRAQAAAAFDLARALALRLTRLQLSPLSAILLAVLVAVTATTGLFALNATLGPSASDDGAVAPDWKPPTLAIVALDPPKPASADLESLSRPIFSKSRKPSPKAAVTPALVSESAAPGALSVTAIVRNRKTAQAFFVSPDAPDGAWRKVGDTVGSWLITAIAPMEVVLQGGGQTTKVKLYADPAPAVDTAAPTAPLPPPGDPTPAGKRFP
jgi:hypothetical protein